MSYYTICPTCGANLDPGERCDCYKLMTADECNEIYRAHEGDAFHLMAQAYSLGYRKAEAHGKEEAAPDAGTSKSGENTHEGAQKHLEFTTSEALASNAIYEFCEFFIQVAQGKDGLAHVRLLEEYLFDKNGVTHIDTKGYKQRIRELEAADHPEPPAELELYDPHIPPLSDR